MFPIVEDVPIFGVDQFLSAHGLTRTEVARIVDFNIGIGESDCLCVSGSLSAGLGNRRSDLDLFLFSDCDRSKLEVGPIIPVRCGPVLADLVWVSPSRWSSCLGKLRAAGEGDIRNALTAPHGDLDFLHRILTAEILVNGDALLAFQSEIPALVLQRVLIHRGITGIEALQIDLLGADEASDLLSLRVLVPRLVNHLVDLLVALCGETNPGEKWRWHLLRRHSGTALPEHCFDQLWELAFGDGEPRAKAQSAVVEANRWIARAQQYLMHGTLILIPLDLPLDGYTAGPLLPPLHLDVAIRYEADGFRVLRLCGSVELSFNEAMARLLSAFDGKRGRAATEGSFLSCFPSSRACATRLLEDVETALSGYDFINRHQDVGLVP